MTDREHTDTGIIRGTFEIKTDPALGAEKLHQFLDAVRDIGDVAVKVSLEITFGEQDFPGETSSERRVPLSEAERQRYEKTSMSLEDLIHAGKGDGICVPQPGSLLWEELSVRDVLVLGRSRIRSVRNVGSQTMAGLTGLLEGYIPDVPWKDNPDINDIAFLCPNLSDVHHAIVSRGKDSPSSLSSFDTRGTSVENVMRDPGLYVDNLRGSLSEAQKDGTAARLVRSAQSFSKQFADARQRLTE